MRPRPLPLLCSAFLALGAAGLPAADWSLGGELSASTALGLGDSRGSESGLFRLSPLLAASGEAWELRLGVQTEASNAPALSRAGLSEARLRLWLGESLGLSLGYGLERGGAAEVFPLAASFGPSDPLSRFEGGGGLARALPEAVARLWLGGSALRLSLAVAPFAPPLLLPSLDSPWFPTELFPAEIEVAGSPLEFGGAIYGPATEGGAFELDPSYEVAADLVAGPFDLGLRLFSGLERAPVLFARILDDAWQYRVELLPRRSRIASAALAGTGIFGALRVWAEAAYSAGLSFATGSYEYGSIPGLYVRREGEALAFTSLPPVIPLDRYAASLGASRDFELGGILGRLLLEATYAWYPEAPAGSAPPELSRALALALSLEGLPARLGASASAMLSLEDGSAAIRPALRLDLGGERGFEASLPLFLGEAGEEFGRYRDHRYLVLSFSERF